MDKQVVDMKRVTVMYPEDATTASIEHTILLGLPEIEGLVPGLNSDQRLAIYSARVSAQRTTFISVYGDMFGVESAVLDYTTIHVESPLELRST